MYSFCALYGCPGFVTEFANFAPEIAISCYQAAQHKDFDKLTQLANRIAPYQQFLAELAQRRSEIPTILSPYISASDLPFYQTVIKEAMGLIGLPSGTVREPMENITPQEREELRKVLEGMGVRTSPH
jgi:dihydrodipicolinate synthase/N-acetylneuraminate lyase